MWEPMYKVSIIFVFNKQRSHTYWYIGPPEIVEFIIVVKGYM